MVKLELLLLGAWHVGFGCFTCDIGKEFPDFGLGRIGWLYVCLCASCDLVTDLPVRWFLLWLKGVSGY